MLKFSIVCLTLLAPILGTPKGFVCPGEGTFPNPEDCASYYVCTKTEVVKMECPIDTAFDPILKICIYAKDANCFDGSTTTSTTKKPSSTAEPPATEQPSSSTTDDGIPHCPENGIQFIENPDDCASFYVCADGNQALNQCPAGYGFDPVSEDCVPADLIGCLNQQSTTQSPQAPVTCPPTGFQPYPNRANCSTFYICHNGNLDIITCPVGYQFDTIDARCEVIGDAKCDGDVTSSSIRPHTTQKPNYNCDNHPNGSTFPDPKDCTKYYQCSNGNIVGNRCAPGLAFNDRLHVCDKPENVNCNVSTPSPLYS